MTDADPGRTVVVFDGVCNLCNGFVRFLIRHDRRDVLRFAHLQAGHDLLRTFSGDRESVVVLRRGAAMTGSDAVLALFEDLGGAWRSVALLRVVPRPFRDALYRFIARHRYGWFGKRPACPVPDEAVRHKFL